MLIQQNSLTVLINKVLGQSAKCRKGGVQLLYHCPFCKESKKIPKMEVCLDQNEFGRWHCWICNAKGGSLSNLFRKLKTNRSYYIELYNITKDSSLLKKREYVRKKDERDIVLPEEFKPMYCPSKSVDYRNALVYLKKRGITRDDILRYNIGYCESGEYRGRVVVPSYDLNGNLNYFVTRTFYKNGGIPYKNCPYSKDVIGFELYINWDEPITLVESVFNAITIRNNSIPLFGKIMSPSLKEVIIERGVTKINLCLDKDAEKDSIRMCDDIVKFTNESGIEIRIVELTLKDPNEIGFDKMNTLINNAPEADFMYLYKKRLGFSN